MKYPAKHYLTFSLLGFIFVFFFVHLQIKIAESPRTKPAEQNPTRSFRKESHQINHFVSKPTVSNNRKEETIKVSTDIYKMFSVLFKGNIPNCSNPEINSAKISAELIKEIYQGRIKRIENKNDPIQLGIVKKRNGLGSWESMGNQTTDVIAKSSVDQNETVSPPQIKNTPGLKRIKRHKNDAKVTEPINTQKTENQKGDVYDEQ